MENSNLCIYIYIYIYTLYWIYKSYDDKLLETLKYRKYKNHGIYIGDYIIVGESHVKSPKCPQQKFLAAKISSTNKGI